MNGDDSVQDTGEAGSFKNTVVAGIDLGDPHLALLVQERLEAVEKLLIDELSDGEDFLTDTALYLAKAGGKRFRPLFTILCGNLGPSPDFDSIVTAATVVEMVHLATLYHDDVMDEADMRRGAVSANARWSNSIAILAGDYLFAHASRLLSTLGPNAVRVIAETFAELVTGQMRETIGAPPAEDKVAHYLKVIREKTASLLAASGKFGGTFSGATSDQILQLERLGDAVGMAFQICDDIIDITSMTETSGKTPGTDLREGVLTLPMLFALDDDGPGSDRLRELLKGPITDDALVEEALTLLRGSRGMARARDTLTSYADSARSELAGFSDSSAKAALGAVIDYTVKRVG
ncbi:polyprenyl synthetase family protein [Hoyosella rhizosphaerae]|uniref:Polyprenyl-diphosphate synthase GrcC1 n=1 Tax=Hoyosella rhizosphaerae TaxID=1755582 RepID=A0A916ULP7_9ACTN|nr:polyprenyl synthetase family protein [Hoyosella rhizosphaerae]MBN4925257.1 polyprenyl synthetase family protein [Hoyosella rhizosphaerae]GGC76708.1 putative polyprenyl-diphosphate synthase GrcC1 [Hoyosella rhizosphaerae]